VTRVRAHVGAREAGIVIRVKAVEHGARRAPRGLRPDRVQGDLDRSRNSPAGHSQPIVSSESSLPEIFELFRTGRVDAV
jgi:hypothetical protein